ncbi:hypothetical protein D3C84_1186080 [compost metagenome]
MITLRHFEDRLDPRPRTSGADSLEALVDENPVVGVQRHHVGDAAEGHQVQQLADVRLRPALVPAEAAQTRA